MILVYGNKSQFIHLKNFFKMSRLTILKPRNSYLTFLMLLLLMLGPAQNSWCLQDGDATLVPDTIITDCHSVPSVCVTSTSILIEQGGEATPADCKECFDLSFEEVATLCIQNSISDIQFAPGIFYLQTPSVLFGEASQSHSFISQVKRPLRPNLNLHRSIQSTVLII